MRRVLLQGKFFFRLFNYQLRARSRAQTFPRDTLARYALIVAFLVAPRRNKEQ